MHCSILRYKALGNYTESTQIKSQDDRPSPEIPYESRVACVASVSNRVIARKLERKQKKVEGGGGGEKRKRLPANLTILENAP